MPITRFGAGNNVYDFTASDVYLENYDDNFGSSVDVTSEFAGMDGVYLSDGDAAGRKPAGSITLALKIVATTREEMDAKRQALLAMRAWGLQPLVYQQTDPSNAILFTYAKAQVNAPRDLKAHSDLFQAATVTFLVPDPYWYASTQGYILGINFLMGISTMGGNPVVINANGLQTDATANNAGTARTLVKIVIAPDTGQSCQNPKIQRIVDGQIHDEVSYAGILTDTDTLVIDPAKLTGPQVTLNGADAYDTNFDFKHLRWMSLLPADNMMRVIFANGGDAATVTLEYLDAYEGS